MACIQCGNDVTSAFCPVCGQRAGVKRLTFRDTLSDFWASVVGLDGIFLRTLKDLTRRPGYVADSYIRGIRLRYFGPIGYFFFMITLLLLWVSMLGLDFAVLIRERQQEMSLTNGNSAGVAVATQWFSDHIKWVLFLAVPFQAIAARYLFFRKSGFNLIEHTVPLFYTSGHLFWLTMLTFLVHDLTGETYTTPVAILSLLYFAYMYQDFMKHQSKVSAFFKGMGVYVGGQLLFMLAMVIAIVAVILVLAVVNPQALESFRPSRP